MRKFISRVNFEYVIKLKAKILENLKKKIEDKKNILTSVLYRLKKYQYLLYKHCLLHGLNITVAADAPQDLLTDRFFRLYWLALNTAYVMEFFLQTLVRRRYMSQTLMLLMNQGAYDATYLISRTT